MVGFFVVLRGASFAAHALPLGAFPGAAAANLLGVHPLVGLLVFSGLGVAGISQLGRRGRNDFATALSLVLLLGLGALFLSRTTELLPGGLRAAVRRGARRQHRRSRPGRGAWRLLAIGLVVLLFRPLLLSSVSPDLGAAQGVSTRLMEVLFLSVVALATAMALPVVGALLVFSLMVGPASAARALTDRPLRAMLISTAGAVVTVWAAIALSFAHRLADRLLRRRAGCAQLRRGTLLEVRPGPATCAAARNGGRSRRVSNDAVHGEVGTSRPAQGEQKSACFLRNGEIACVLGVNFSFNFSWIKYLVFFENNFYFAVPDHLQ